MNYRQPGFYVALALLLLIGSMASMYFLGPQSFEPETCSPDSDGSIRAIGFDPSYDPVRVLDRVESITDGCTKATIRVRQDDSYTSFGERQNEFVGIHDAGSMTLQLYSNRTSTESHAVPLGITETSPELDEITIRLASRDRIAERGLTQEVILAHELVHATSEFDDEELQAVSERLPDEPTTDYVLALRGVREGEAMWVMATYAEQYGKSEVNVTRYRDIPPKSAWEQGLASVVYYYGYVHERDGYSTESDQPVISTRQLLHPDAPLPPQMPERDSSIQSNGDFRHVSSDRVGELAIRYSLRTNGLSLSNASEAAAGWQNGRMDYYRTSDHEDLVHWETYWTNATEAREFATTWRSTYSDGTNETTDLIHVRATEYAPAYYYRVDRNGDKVGIVGAADRDLVRNATR